jgi:hypothetical protein
VNVRKVCLRLSPDVLATSIHLTRTPSRRHFHGNKFLLLPKQLFRT